MLGHAVVGAHVLDLYAGSGALALEALSRGARAAVLVEESSAAIRVIGKNIQDLQVHESVRVRRTRAEAYVRARPSPDNTDPPCLRDGPFDLAFLDPPYALEAGPVAGILRALRCALTPGAWVVVESSSRREPPVWPSLFRAQDPRRYGDTAVHLASFHPEDSSR